MRHILNVADLIVIGFMVGFAIADVRAAEYLFAGIDLVIAGMIFANYWDRRSRPRSTLHVDYSGPHGTRHWGNE